MADSRNLRSLSGAAVAGITLALAAVLLFKDLGLEGIAVDEATTTVVEVEMVRDGHWFFPTFRELPEARKPPLKMWLTAATLALAPETEFTLRFWDAAFGLGTVALVFWLGFRMAGPIAAFTAALALVTVPEFLFDHCARTNVQDSPLVFFTSAAAIAYAFGPRTRRGAFYAGLFAACALLVKGVAAFALIATVAVFEIVTTGGRGLFRSRLWIFAATAFSVAALWFVPAHLMMGNAVSDELAKDVFARARGGEYFHRWAFYLLKMEDDLGPWLFALPFAVVAIVRSRERAPWIVPVWATVMVFLFTMAGSKYPWYVLPAYPAVAVLVGVGASELVTVLPSFQSAAGTAFTLLAVAALFAPAYGRAYRRTGQIWWEHSNLRAFERFVSTSVPREVPIFLYKFLLNHTFAGHETFYAFKLRDRLREVKTAENLCAALDASPKGAFVIADESRIGEIPCLAGFESSLGLRRLSHATRGYAPKRIIPYRIATPPLFSPAEVRLETAFGEGLGSGWAETIDDSAGRRIVGERAFLTFDLHDRSPGTLRVTGAWTQAVDICTPRLVLNGRDLGAFPERAPGFSVELADDALVDGRNFLEFYRPCNEVGVAIERVTLRQRGEDRGLPDAAGIYRRIPPFTGLIGREIYDRQAREGRAVVGGGGADRRTGYLFFAPLPLPPGRYTATFDLRSRGAKSNDPVATIDVFAEDGHRTFARRRLSAQEISGASGYVPVSLDFTLSAAETAQPRVEVTGGAEVRFGGVTVRSERGWPRTGAANRR